MGTFVLGALSILAILFGTIVTLATVFVHLRDWVAVTRARSAGLALRRASASGADVAAAQQRFQRAIRHVPLALIMSDSALREVWRQAGDWEVELSPGLEKGPLAQFLARTAYDVPLFLFSGLWFAIGFVFPERLPAVVATLQREWPRILLGAFAAGGYYYCAWIIDDLGDRDDDAKEWERWRQGSRRDNPPRWNVLVLVRSEMVTVQKHLVPFWWGVFLVLTVGLGWLLWGLAPPSNRALVLGCLAAYTYISVNYSGESRTSSPLGAIMGLRLSDKRELGNISLTLIRFALPFLIGDLCSRTASPVALWQAAPFALVLGLVFATLDWAKDLDEVGKNVVLGRRHTLISDLFRRDAEERRVDVKSLSIADAEKEVWARWDRLSDAVGYYRKGTIAVGVLLMGLAAPLALMPGLAPPPLAAIPSGWWLVLAAAGAYAVFVGEYAVAQGKLQQKEGRRRLCSLTRFFLFEDRGWWRRLVLRRVGVGAAAAV